MNVTDISGYRDRLDAVASASADRGYLRFLDHVVVDAQPVKKPFSTIAEWWQWERADRSAGAVDHLCGIRADYSGVRSFWEEYHKGSDKTHEDARQLLFVLGWSRRALNLYVCAGSEDQAALITTAMRGICRDNPWIAERVEVSTLTARGKSGSTLTVLPKNAYNGQGIFPDYVVASEVTHWQHDDGRRMWEFVLESVNKRPHCVLKVETNAGLKGGWQWEERERIRRNADPLERRPGEEQFWGFYAAPVGPPLPTWMNQAKIDHDSQGLTPGERDRLYRNRWVDPGEEHGYLTADEAMLCRDPRLGERMVGAGRDYWLVTDYGGVDDRCALAVMHSPPGTNIAIVDRLDCWQGTRDDRVAINADPLRPDERSVEAWLETVLRNFGGKHGRIAGWVVDPAQLEGLAIKYERRGLPVHRFEYRGGKGNYRLAQMLKTAVQGRTVSWSPAAGLLPEQYTENGRVRLIEDRTLEQELAMLVTRPMSYGYRIDHESGRHDDRAFVIGAGLLYALPAATPAGSVGPTVVPAPKATPLYRPPGTDGRSADDKWNERKPAPTSLNGAVGRWGMYGVGTD